MVNFIWFIFLGLILFILPGLFLISFAGIGFRLRLIEKVGLASSLSLSLYPLFFLWGNVLGLQAMAVYSFLPLFLSFFLALLRWLQRPSGSGPFRFVNRDGLALNKLSILYFCLGMLVLFGIFYSRWLAIKGMVAPAWGDSVHHTLIVKLILRNGGLFKSWAPYAPIESLTYHFGLHGDVACWAWLSGLPAHQALLWAGQFLNGLAVIALFPLALKLTGNRWAAWGAMIVAGLLFPLPGYYVNWGRYTQLAGMVILPGIIWVWDEILMDRLKEVQKTWSFPRESVLLGLLFSGLFLTHYSVFVLAVCAGLAWLAFALGYSRFRVKLLFRALGEVAIAAILGGLLVFPWLWSLKQGRLTQIFLFSTRAARSLWLELVKELGIWLHLDFYFPDFYWIATLLVLGLSLIFRRRLALPLLLFGAVSLAVANLPVFFLLKRTFLPNDVLVFSLYIPIALLLAWAGVWAIRALGRFIVTKKWTFQLTKDDRLSGLIIAIVCIPILFFGSSYQARVADPFFQMVTVNDLEAFRWIRNNTPREAKFLINGFLIYEKEAAAGSDAGWWLPYFTSRQTLIPPLIYNIEKLGRGFDRKVLAFIIKSITETQGDLSDLKTILHQARIDFIYLGEKRGQVCYDAGELVPEEWLRNKNGFKLVFQKGKAQVWKVVD